MEVLMKKQIPTPKEGDIKIRRGVTYIRKQNPWYHENSNGFHWVIKR
jgi:hypothetical protein